VSWEDLSRELGEMFDEYSWHEFEIERAMERRAAQQRTVSAVRLSWQQSAIYKAQKREARRRYLARHKPWLRPERREYMRKYRAEKRASGEVKTSDTDRARRWRAANRERYNEYQRAYAKAKRVPKQRKRTDPEILKQRKRDQERAAYQRKIADPQWLERRREISRNTFRRYYERNREKVLAANKERAARRAQMKEAA
jgi:hypothetical protein